jgi:hypothetical protein
MLHLVWGEILLFVLPRVAGMADICHYTQSLVEMGVSQTFFLG